MSHESRRIRIDQLAFTGPERDPVFLSFEDGVNIVWGASNTGKSFARKSIDYVLGGENPTLPPEGKGYDNYLLWLTLPNAVKITLRRSDLGGDIYKADGHVFEVGPRSNGYESLLQRHARAPNVSRFLLAEAGFREAQLLKNERAEKSPFSLRTLMRYLLIDETRMIDEKSILLAHNTTVTAEDKGLIKFLLTGVDGSSVEQVRSADQLKAARDGKIELLSQMSDELRVVIDDTVEVTQVRSMLEDAGSERDDLLAVLSTRQDALDDLSSRIRVLDDEIRAKGSRIADLQAMIVRFEELAQVYSSDVERLKGLEEGGFLLQRFAKINCPLCGASPPHQQHDHGLANVEEQRQAVEAEIAKIEAEAGDLASTISAARDEIATRESRLQEMTRERASDARRYDEARKMETSARTVFTVANERFRQLESDLELRQRLGELEHQIEHLRGQTVRSRQRADSVDVNLDMTQSDAHELSKVIKDVLLAWNYPGAGAVHFERGDYDIVVDGKRRRDNGAGVRALLHAAFKVGVLVHCIEKGRPHPGFLILDSPLLAYRPAEETRYGELHDDEMALREAGVASRFYAHLHGMRDRAQFIIIENHRSDQEVVEPYPNVQFTKNPEVGRIGLFV